MLGDIKIIPQDKVLRELRDYEWGKRRGEEREGGKAVQAEAKCSIY